MDDPLDAVQITHAPLVSIMPKRVSVLMSLILVMNTALTIYAHVGVSASLKTSIDPNLESEEGEFVCSLEEVSRCGNDDLPIWEASRSSLSLDATECVITHVSATSEEFPGLIADCIQEKRGYSAGCSQCFGVLGACGRQACVEEITNLVPCLDRECFGCFYSCTGFDYYVPDAPESNFSLNCVEDDVEMFEVFDVSFVNTIETTYQGEAYFLMVVLFVFSGLWPYVKNIMITLIWFGLVPSGARQKMMSALLLFGKWSLVDVYAVIILVVGARIHKEITPGAPLYITAEPRFGILAFLFAALSHMMQAEWIHLTMHRQKLQTKKERHHLQPLPVVGMRRFIFTLVPLVSFVFVVVGGAVLNSYSISLQGILSTRPGSNILPFSAWSTGADMFGACITGFGNSQVEIGQILGLFQVISVVLLPACCAVGIALTTFFKLQAKESSLFLIMLCNFASADVFVFSLLAMLSKYKDLIETSISQAGATLCPGATAEECLRAIPSLQTGLWLLIASVPLFWGALFFTLRSREIPEVAPSDMNDENDESVENGKGEEKDSSDGEKLSSG